MKYSIVLFALIAAATTGCSGHLGALANAPTVNLSAVPDGHYLVTLEFGGRPYRLNLKVEQQYAVCVASEHANLRNLQGRFQLIGNGVFLVTLANNQYRGSQYWIFNPTGSAVIKEIPDRGETQHATPVSTDSLEAPAKS